MSRLRRWVGLVVVVTLALVVVAPQPQVARYRPGEFPLSWMWRLFEMPAGWAGPASPDTPQQKGGSAAGKSHAVDTAATRSGAGQGHLPGKGPGQLDAFVPHVRKAQPGSSGSSAGDRSFNASTSVRIPSASTATSTMYRNADGSFTRKVFQDAVNFQAADGSWTPIDSSLVSGVDGRLHERADPEPVDFAGSGSDSSLAHLSLPGDVSVGWALQGASAVTPQVSGDTTTYAGVLPATDLELSAIGSGVVKESLLLHSADAPSSWVFPLRLTGVSARLAPDGAVEYVDAAGTVVGRTPPAYMEDSNYHAGSLEPVESHAVTYELTTVDGGPALRMTADAAWLRDPARVFPVTVDPSYQEFTTGSTFAESPYNNDYSGQADLKVGWNGTAAGDNHAYSFLKFDTFYTDYQNAHVTAVSLNVFDFWAWTCDAEPFSVNPITSSWSPSGVRTYPGPSFGGSIGSLTADPGAACKNTGHNEATGTWMGVPLNVDTFNSWARGGTNYGLALTASQSDDRQWKQFDSYYGPNRPYLQVTYADNVPPQIDSQYPPDNYDASTLQPELMAYGHDPDSSPLGYVNYDFTVYDSSLNPLWSTGWAGANHVQVPSGVLAWGKTYWWTVQSGDGATASDPNVSLQVLNTPPPQPMITSGLSQNSGGHGFDPNIGNYTTSATDAQVATAGPALSVVRNYNSLDPRTGGAFGAGWSSVLDAKATESGNTVVVTYPDGSEVAYGKNADGSFSPPQGRFATFRSVPGGYSLTDKNGMVYTFTQALSAGVYGITSIADADARTETFWYASGHLATVTAASGRSLHLTWTTPTGGSPHVTKVVTDPATVGDSSTVLTWTYSYTGNLLTAVCPPTSSTACTTYGYTDASQYPNAVLNLGPHSSWRLDETSGTNAASGVLSNEHTDDATYSNVTLGQPGHLGGSQATAAGFNGTSSLVKLPSSLVQDAEFQTISMWFKTTTPGNYVPTLYIGSDGKLLSEFWGPGCACQIATPNSVTDGNWHNVVLAGAGDSQSLYLDGAWVDTRQGLIQQLNGGATYEYVGAGFLGGDWVDEPHQYQSGITGYATYFNGSIADVAFYNQALSGTDVASLYAAGSGTGKRLTKVTRPSGGVYANVTYDGVTGNVTQVVDETGATWGVGAPTVSGSSAIYAGSVLGSQPSNYWRMSEASGQQPINQVRGGTAQYINVGVGANGPFQPADPDTAATFDGSTSLMQLPDRALSNTGSAELSLELWFRTTSTSAAVLVGDAGYPMLWVGSDHLLYGGFWTASGSRQMSSNKTVTDGNWHHVVLSGQANGTQTIYLDGQQVASSTGAALNVTQSGLVAGYAQTGSSWSGLPSLATLYFNGTLDEIATYSHALSAAEVAAHYAGYKSANSSLAPLVTAVVTDPGGQHIQNGYDPLHGYRQVFQVDALGHKTAYGYDTSGFLNTVTDPNGAVTTTGHDVRGNVVSRTTCQDQSDNKCGTVYYTYYPDDTSTTLSPDPRNDLVLTMRDARSSGPSDNTYLTTYTYNSVGERTGVTTPPVAGFPSGRTVTTAYTTTSTPAADGGTTLAGLPLSTTTPAGATQTMSYLHTGDVATTTDAAGLVTRFTYDNLGRVLTATTVSGSYPNGLVTAYSYDGLGRTATQTDPAVLDRVTGATHTARTTTVYDPDGDMLSQSVADLTGGDATRTVSFTYNDHDQQTSQTDSGGSTTTFGYDVYGNKSKDIDPAGTETDYVYGPTGQLWTTTLKGYTGDPANPSPARDLVESSRAYDPAGRLASVTDSMGWVTSYTYTDDGKVATVTRTDPVAGTSFVQQDNTYDPAGNLVSQKTNNETTLTTYSIDAASRTTSTVVDPTGVDRTTSYGYSPDDTVLTTTISDAHGSQVTDATYDPVGRLTSRDVRLDGAGRPTAWWKLNETAGTIAGDSSGSGTTATANQIAWGAQAATLNGTSSFIQGPDNLITTTGNESISLWFTTSGTNQVLLGYQGGSMSNPGAVNGYVPALYIGSDGKLQGQLWDNSIGPMSSPAAVNDNQWHHVVLAASSSGQTLYLDGTQVGSKTIPVVGWGASSTQTYFGTGLLGGAWPDESHSWADPPVAGYLGGQLSDIQIYPRVLSAADVSTLHSAGRTGAALGTYRPTTTYTLDQRGLPTAVTDPNGNVTNYTYDEAGRLAVTVSPSVNTETGGGTPVSTRPISSIGYDTFGAQVEMQDPNGNVTVTAYDAGGRPLSTRLPNYTPPGASTPIVATTSRTYNKVGQVDTETDPLGHVTTYTYDQLGDVATVTAPNTGVTHNTYDTNGDQLSTADPTGAVSQATYDWLGRHVTTTQVVRQPSPAAYTTTYAYNPAGYLSSVTTPAGVVTSMTYDAVGEQATVRDNVGNTTRYAYDFLGHTTKTTQPDGTAQTVTYDAAGRAVGSASLDASGATLTTTSATYDADSNMLTSTDARGTTRTFTYDATGKLTSQVQPVATGTSITTTFGYDAAGNQTRYTDGRGNPWITTYNSWNLPESRIEPSTPAHPNLPDRTFTTAYDAAAQVASQQSPGGVSVTNTYDTIGDLTGQSGTGAEAATVSRTIGYDLAGRPTSASAPAGTDTFSYDDRGLLLSTTGPSGASSFGYTPDGLMSSRQDAAGTTSYTYDTADRLATMTNTGSGVQTSYTYNPLSQVSRVAYGTNADTRTLGYDNLHRLTSDILATSGGTTIASIGYGYDPDGNLTSKTTSGFVGSATSTYTYDLANRLTSWGNGTTTIGYGYDAAGNRTQVGANTYTYDARDELTSAAGTTYAYTARGTLATATTGSAIVNTTSDAFGQTLTQGSASYSYDALGRVVNPGFAYTGTGNTLASDGTATYTRDPSNALAAVSVAGTNRLAWTDQHTDVVGEFTPSGTNLAGSVTYDPFGNVIASAAMQGNLGYQSEWTDSGTGQVNMAARWYNPATGQFDSRDSATVNPVPNAAAANPFTYAADNPLGGTDPSGHFSLSGAFHSAVHTVSSGISSAVSSASNWVSSTWNTVTTYATQAWAVTTAAWDYLSTKVTSAFNAAKSWVSNQYDKAKAEIKKDIDKGKQILNAAVDKVKDDYQEAKQAVWKAANDLKQATSNVAHTVTNAVTHPVQALSTAYHATVSAATNIAHYAEAHAASIASFVVSTAAFMGCEGLMTAMAPGVGTVAGAAVCGGLAGMVGSLTSGLLNGQSITDPKLWMSVGIGGLVGAAGGGIGGAIARSMTGELSQIGGSLVDRMITGATTGAVAGAAGGGASSAVNYGVGCLSGDSCSASGFAGAVGEGTLTGAVMGAAGGALGGASAKGCAHSFDPATPVLMADGTSKPIGDVQLGDKVASTDPTSGSTTTEPVVALHDNHDTDLADVTTRATNGTVTVLHTTWHHPFWNATTGTWTEAKDLKPGTHLATTNSQTVETVIAVNVQTGQHEMNDLTIANTHTYYVEAGDTPVLVHNCGGDVPNDPRAVSNPRTGRDDSSWSTYDKALKAAQESAGGDFGPDAHLMYDHNPETGVGTGTLIGQQTPDHIRGWRIDNDKDGYHVNWWDWSGGKKGTGGAFGHAWIPEDPTGPGSRGIGWAPWQDSNGNIVEGN